MLPQLKIAVATSSFQMPLRQAISAAAAMGATGLQLDVQQEVVPLQLTETGRRHFLHQLSEVGLRISSLHLTTRKRLSDEDSLDARLEVIKQSMQISWELGCRVLSLRIGQIPMEADSPQRTLLLEVLRDLARHANHIGVIPAILPTHDTPAALRELLDAVTTGPLGIDFDPAGMLFAGQNPAEAYRQLYRDVQEFQIRDGIRNIDGTGKEVTVGRGEVDWLELLPLLEESRYANWLTIVKNTGDDRAADAARAVQFLRHIAAGGN